MAKERKLSKGQGVYNLKRYIENRGISADLIDLDALYDSELSYAENKKNILKQIGLAQDMEEKEYLMQEIDAVQDSRSARAQALDAAKRAQRTYNVQNVAGLREWTKAPNRVDIEGIDAFSGSKKTATKKSKSKKRGGKR